MGKPILNQDPRLRAQILPLFRFDPAAPSERPFGLGTAFRLDPWGGCATAFHVIEDLLTLVDGGVGVRDNVRIVGLEVEGLLYGAPPIPKDAWRPLLGFYAEFGKSESPLLHQPDRIQNLTELACLTISRSDRASPMPYLPTALAIDQPKAGDVVTAYGFAGLDTDPNGRGEARPMSQYLYQSSGEVIEVLATGQSASMPWPMVRVSAEWPSGMSGGPVMNADGKVIGLVSRSWADEADSSAVLFAGTPVSRRTFPSLDPENTGWFRAFAAIDAADNVRFLGQDLHEAKAFASKDQMRVLPVTCDPQSGDWVSLA